MLFLVYLDLLEPRERVWWLQMSFSFAGGTNNAPSNPLAVFEGPFRGGERQGEREGRGKGKEGNWEGRNQLPGINFWLPPS